MPPLTPEIIKLTGIDQAMLDEFAVEDTAQAFVNLIGLMCKADAVVAHNAPFDKGFVEKAFELLSIDKQANIKWIDSSVDVPYPDTFTTRKLTYLAAEYQFINPFAHRALFDVLTMCKVLSCFDINEIERWADSPNLTLVADVKKPWNDKAPEGEKEADLAKEHGFRFNGTDKLWKKTVKEFQLDEEREAYKGKFPVRIVKE
jgi:DNA polymerase-3 subunit epsilon